MIDLRNIEKVYHIGQRSEVTALKRVSLHVNRGEFVAIMGPSGSGKSTLLNIIGCMDSPTSGEIYLDGINISGACVKQLHSFRSKYISFIFQDFSLMDGYTAEENIAVPLIAQNIPRKKRREVIREHMEMLGIAELRDKWPNECSGGQQQRIAIARALVSKRPVLLADEPTGALDQRTGRELMKLLCSIRQNGTTIVLITHDPQVASYADRQLLLEDGMMKEVVKRL